MLNQGSLNNRLSITIDTLNAALNVLQNMPNNK